MADRNRPREELEDEVRGLRARVAELEQKSSRDSDLFERLRVLIDQSYPEWLAICDADGNIEAASAGVERITGYSNDEIQGRPPGEVWKSGHMDEQVYRDLWRALDAGRPYRNVFVNRKKSGALFSIDQTIAPLFEREEDGEVKAVNYVSTGRELPSELSEDEVGQMAQGMRYLALVDPLTELPNRTLFNDLFERALAVARHTERRLALLLIDINRFVFINQRFGVEVGDQVLRFLGQRLRELSGETNLVARVGADEFAIVLTDVEAVEDVVLFADRARREASEPFTIGGDEILITTSTGVSVYPDDGELAQKVITHASIALSKARKVGHSECVFFKERMNREAAEFLSLKEGLYTARQQDEFRVFYQPYFCLRSQRMAGLEALVRWKSDRLGNVSPVRFIPVLEDTGLIRDVGRRIAELVCEQLGRWRAAGMRVPVSLNLSARQFSDEALVEDLLAITSRHGVVPADLVLEITESTFMEDIERTNAILGVLKDSGFRIAIDDFGTGYSSLSYLRRLPIDLLKIDISFIREIEKSSEDASIVSAVVSMARDLELVTIAEGVETEAQLRELRRLRCNIGQGFLWSHPLPADALEAAFPDYFGANAPSPHCDATPAETIVER